MSTEIVPGEGMHVLCYVLDNFLTINQKLVAKICSPSLKQNLYSTAYVGLTN